MAWREQDSYYLNHSKKLLSTKHGAFAELPFYPKSVEDQSRSSHSLQTATLVAGAALGWSLHFPVLLDSSFKEAN